MKKNAFFTLVCLLFAFLGQAQTLSTISGVVTKLSDGSPVVNHQVFCVTGDSINPVFADGITNPDGSYSIDLVVPPGYTEVFVGTLAFCDAANPFISTNVTPVNGAATADFQICEDSFPPMNDCYADIFITPVDSLTFQFTGYYYSFFDSTQQAASFFWDFGDGTTSTDENPTHTYAQDGFYFVTLTVTGTNGCVATIQYPFETSFNGFPECMGYILYNQSNLTTFDFSAELYDATGSIIQADSYNWDFGDGETSTEANPSHTYAVEGVYTVLLHAITDAGCEIHSCDVVFALDCPVDTFWYGCQAMFATSVGGFDPNGTPTGDLNTVSFIDLSLGGVTAWAWDFGDGSSSTEQNPVHTYAADGVYTVTLSITTVSGCESTMSFEICVGNNCWLPEFDCQALFIPIPDSLGGNGIQFLDFSVTQSPIQGWAWDFGDGTTSTDQNPYHVYAQPGIYTVSLSIEADSCNSVISFEFDTESPWNFNSNGDPAKLGLSSGATATHEPTAFDAVKLFPNPAQQEVSLAFSSKKAGDYQLRITDLTGKTMLTSHQTANVGVNAARLNVSNLVPGLYLAEIRSGESVQTIKFVKQ